MRVRLTDGTREVEISTRGTTDDTALLRQIERTARRLYAALPTEPSSGRSPFGFGRHLDGIALDSATERADPDTDTPLEDEDPPA
ncbi:hypothetical protein [Streptomyces sp. B15]|uniref:hypothetical protein n=1 Tax=Streptomyces sp. B15 TaxID=1537797 RepID=UPI001B396560|nr:hypothetical protein [Streptomyces sp. B15]MBQ1122630.1 hypothetical protein [Streptomyces sp. B15]